MLLCVAKNEKKMGRGRSRKSEAERTSRSLLAPFLIIATSAFHHALMPETNLQHILQA
jgi:hypothetical protein